MSDRDLAGRLRQLAEAERMDREQPSVALTLDDAADRIESLEAERDKAVLIADAQRIRGDDLAHDRDRAEARLARVTDLVMDTDGGWLSGDDFDGLAGAIQEAIRAVAADEQARCLHCRRPIRSEDGRYWGHAEGLYRGKARCDPDDSGLPYGYNAHPDVASGEQVGCKCGAVAADEQPEKEN